MLLKSLKQRVVMFQQNCICKQSDDMKTEVRRMLRGAIHTQHCTISSELLIGERGGVGVNVTAGKKTMLGK